MFINNKQRELRNNQELYVPITANHYGENTFSYFFINFYKNFGKNEFYNSYNVFRNKISVLMKNYFIKFIKLFPKFNLIYKNLDYFESKNKKIY